MKILSVYLIKNENPNIKQLKLVDHGFNYTAMLITFFWAIYNGFYFRGLTIFIYTALSLFLLHTGILNQFEAICILLYIHIYTGFSAQTWVNESFIKKYKLYSIEYTHNAEVLKNELILKNNVILEDSNTLSLENGE